jgi:hypothetical protein
VQIRTDDKAGAPTSAARLSIGNASVVEGDSTTRPLRFSVSLSTTKTTAVTVDYATSDGPAPAADSGDYAGKTGTVTIPAGQTSAVLTVNVRADTTVEPTERFTLKLSDPVGATIQFGTATGSIHNDD